MADLKQALIWLAEGKKITCKKFMDHNEYLHLKNCLILDEDDVDCAACLQNDNWEIYEEPKPIPPCGNEGCNCEYDPREVQLKDALVDEGEYIVWGKNNERSFAFWDADDKAFYSLVDYTSFPLDVKEWKKLPERDDEN